MNKQLVSILCLLLCGLLLAGCSCAPSLSGEASSVVDDDAPPGSPQGLAPSPAEKDVSVAPDTSGVAASGTAGTAGSAPAAQEGPATGPNEEQTFTAVLDDVAMGTYYVMMDDGLVLQIVTASIDDSGLSDTLPGAQVVVRYRGTLNGNDTSGVTFISIANP